MEIYEIELPKWVGKRLERETGIDVKKFISNFFKDEINKVVTKAMKERLAKK